MNPSPLFNLVMMSKDGTIVKYDDYLAKNAGTPHVDPTPVDPYNPLGLPPFTIRCKFEPGTTPEMGDSQTLVDATENIWDITKNSTNWRKLFDRPSPSLLQVLGANTSSVTDMSGMFALCMNLSDVPLFDTSSVTKMSSMFAACSALKTVPLFDTSSVTAMDCMFQYCVNVTGGALALYTQASTQTTPPISYDAAFLSCGQNTETGTAELAQIPKPWGGTMPDPVESLVLTNTVNHNTLSISTEGDTSTLDHYEVHVYRE